MCFKINYAGDSTSDEVNDDNGKVVTLDRNECETRVGNNDGT
jgi:hypothetical protein